MLEFIKEKANVVIVKSQQKMLKGGERNTKKIIITDVSEG